MNKLSVAWSLTKESLVRMPKSTNSSHIPYQWDNCNTKRSRSPWNTNYLTVLSNRIWCFFAQSIWTLEFLLTFLTLSFYTSCVSPPVGVTMIHNRRVLSNARTFFQTKISSKLLHHILSFSLLCFFCCLILCPSVGLGRKKVQLSVLCPCLPPSLLLADNTWQQIFWTVSHFDLINRLNSTQNGQIMLVTHVCIRQQPPCQVLPAIHSLWEGLSQCK